MSEELYKKHEDFEYYIQRNNFNFAGFGISLVDSDP